MWISLKSRAAWEKVFKGDFQTWKETVLNLGRFQRLN